MDSEQENALLRRIVANQREQIETLQDALALEWARNNPVIELDSEDLEDDGD